MERFKRGLNKLLFPPVKVIILLVPVAAALLTLTFAFDWTEQPVAIASYFLSAYALTIVCARAPALVRAVRAVKQDNRYIRRYTSDAGLRIKLSLYISVAVNLLYALLQLGSGFYYHSVWFYALSGYYALLGLMRFFLLRDARRTTLGLNRLTELYRYRFCGMILLLVNLAIAVIITFIVSQNRGFAYNEILSIAMAAYTFFAMGKAIVDIVKYRRYESPVMSAAKAINLAAALMSMMSLETALISAFGSGENPIFRRVMTASTGAAVCLAVLAMALYMIVTSTKAIHSMKKEIPE